MTEDQGSKDVEATGDELSAPNHGPRKRGRESALGPATPLGEEDKSIGTTPNPKRNRLQSQATPPVDQSRQRLQGSLSPEPALPEDHDEEPGTPPLGPSDLDETSKVKAIRHKVRNMTTTEEQANSLDDMSAVDAPPSPVEASADSLPDETILLGESAAHPGLDQAAVPPEDNATPPANAASPTTPKSSFATFSSRASPFSNVAGSSTSAFGPSKPVTPSSYEPLPVSRPNLAALQRLDASLRAPSPASSIRAEVGSAPPTSRRASFGSIGPKSDHSERSTSPTPEPQPTTPVAVAEPPIDAPTDTKGHHEPYPTPAVPSADLPTTEQPLSPGAVNRKLQGTSSDASLTSSTPSAFGKVKSVASGFGSFSSFSSPFARAKGGPAPSLASGAAAPSSPFASVAQSSKDEGFSLLLKKEADKIEKTDKTDKGKQVLTAQEVVTGEEGEQVVFSSRAKLFVMEGDAYKENGIGTFKLNREIESLASSRLLMRTDATHRLILNAKVFRKMHFEPVENKYVRFSVIIEGGLKTYLAKFGNAQTAAQLAEALKDAVARLAELEGPASPPLPV